MKPAFVLIAVLPLSVVTAACSKAGADSRSSRPYKVGVVDRGEVRVTVEETGVVDPERSIVVKSPISGVVQQLYVREGDRVQPGQALARILPTSRRPTAWRNCAAKSSARASRVTTPGGLRPRAGALGDRRHHPVGPGPTARRLRAGREPVAHGPGPVAAGAAVGRHAGDSGGGGAQWARIIAPTAGVVIARGVEEGETVVAGPVPSGRNRAVHDRRPVDTDRQGAINEVDIGKVARGDHVALTVDAFPATRPRASCARAAGGAPAGARAGFDVEVEVTEASGSCGRG